MKKPTNRPQRTMVQSVPRLEANRGKATQQQNKSHVAFSPVLTQTSSGKNSLDADLGVIQTFKGPSANPTAPRLPMKSGNASVGGGGTQPELTSRQQKYLSSVSSTKGFIRGVSKSTPGSSSSTSVKIPEVVLPENSNTSPVRFPIDIVYTWVDGSDDEWLKLRYKFQPTQRNIPADSLQNCRWRDFDELRLSIESVYRFAPWIRNIYVISDFQRPYWFDESNPGKIKFVDHPDLFGDFNEHLPTFNSHAIECHLHRIDGLANNFIYANDDTFFGNDVFPLDFFTEDGRSKIFLTINDMETEQSIRQSQTAQSSQPVVNSVNPKWNPKTRHNEQPQTTTTTKPPEQLDILPYFTSQAIANKILNQVFGEPLVVRKRLKHQMKAFTKDIFEWCWENEIFQMYLFHTSSTRFRSLSDVDVTSLVSHTALLLKAAIPAGISSKYYGMEEGKDIRRMFEYMYKLKPSPKLYCINDNMAFASSETLQAIRDGFEKYLPHKFM